jgi:hypothetical protein
VITITRRQARRLKAVFRRSMLGTNHRGLIPPLVLLAVGTKLRAQYRYGALAVEHDLDVARPADGTIAVPLDMLADVAGRDETPVVLEPAAPERTIARWHDAGIPQLKEYDVTELVKLAPFPDAPATFTTVPTGLLAALEEACRTAAEDSTRYALNCIQLRGRAGQIAATDGRQLLISGGLELPWMDDVLVHRTPLFGCRELRAETPVELGRTDTYVVLKVGPWTIFLEVQKDARFPRVDDVLPSSAAARTRLELTAEDAVFLSQSLDRLPGGDEPDAPVTLELNGRVLLRARAAEGPTTELILSRSSHSGDPVRLATNREYLARAVRLGFRCVEIATAKEPVACRDEHRTFGWQPLSPEVALEPTEDAVRVDSTSTKPTTLPTRPQKDKHAMNGSQPHSPQPAKKTVSTNGDGPGKDTGITGLAGLIRDAETLYQTLGQAKSHTGKLVRALRRHRRQSKLVASTLASLRELQLQDVSQ